jgi:flagellar basal-body rod protein FlgB
MPSFCLSAGVKGKKLPIPGGKFCRSVLRYLAACAGSSLYFDGTDCAFVTPCYLEVSMSALAEKLSVYSQAMNLRTQRHQLLASNIANADTPNYKARDFNFEKAMQNAMAGHGAGSITMTTTSIDHLVGSGASTPAALQFRAEVQSSVDGNTVDMDVERSQISENAIQYQIVSQLITETFKGMRTALSTTSS